MIRIVIALTVSLIGFICKAQVSENRTIADFKTIEASSGVEVRYTQSKATTLKVTTDDADKLKKISTEVNNGVLKITVKPGKGEQNFKVLRVDVSNPAVNTFKIKSAAKLTVENSSNNDETRIDVSSGAQFKGNVKAKNVQLELNSGSGFQGEINATVLVASLSGAAKATVSGNTNEIKLKAHSAAVFKGADLKAKYAIVEAENASKVGVSVSEKLDAKASSVAAIEYYGKPKTVTADKKSLGTITAK